MKMNEQNNFAVSEFILNKRAESNFEAVKNKVIYMTGNTRCRSRRHRYKTAVNVSNFDTISFPLQRLSSSINGLVIFLKERERECRNPIRLQQISSGDVGCVT